MSAQRLRAERLWERLTIKPTEPVDMIHLGKAIEIGTKYCLAREQAKPPPLKLNKHFTRKKKHQSFLDVAQSA